MEFLTVLNMYCEKCGKQIKDNEHKCNYCGAVIDDSVSNPCFTNDDFTVFKICGTLISASIIGIAIILFVSISNSQNKMENNKGHLSEKAIATGMQKIKDRHKKKTQSNNNTINENDNSKEDRYVYKYTDDFVFEIDDEENYTYTRDDKISIVEDYLSKTLYNDWYDIADNEVYSVDDKYFMGASYRIKKFSFDTEYPEFADITVVLEDDYSFIVHMQYDIYSKYSDEIISGIEIEEGFFYSNITYTKYYTVEYDEICRLDAIMADDVENQNNESLEFCEDEYIFPYSDSEFLTEGDVRGLSKEELRLARNEIFARYGYVFESEDLQDYFNSKSWYTPNYSSGNVSEDMLNDYERANVDLIREYE